MQLRTPFWMIRRAGLVVMLGLSLVVAASASKGRAMKPLDANEPFLKSIDARLPSLARNPKLFTRLHQEDRFLNEAIYKDIRLTSLIDASLPLPALFKEDGTTVPFDAMAVCMADRRIFVRGRREGADFVGWVPLVTPDFVHPQAEAVLAFILIKGGEGKLLTLWAERRVSNLKRRDKLGKVELGASSVQTNVEDPKEWQAWLDRLLKESIGRELHSTSLLVAGEKGLELRGTLKTKMGAHDVKVRAGVDTFVVTVRLYPPEGTYPVPCPSAMNYLKDEPFALLDWPPDRPPPPPLGPPPAPEENTPNETPAPGPREKKGVNNNSRTCGTANAPWRGSRRTSLLSGRGSPSGGVRRRQSRLGSMREGKPSKWVMEVRGQFRQRIGSGLGNK